MGLMLALFSISYLMPIAASLIVQDNTWDEFTIAMAINAGTGSLLWFLTRHANRELRPADGFLLVVFAWSGMAAFATVPLLLVLDGLSFTDAYFETISGLTTTGATVLTGLDALPAAINLWRHELNWLGGMGIIVLAVAILPLLGVGGRQLYMAETPGPMKDARLAPRIAETARNLWIVYAAITLLCALCLKLAGMSALDAVSHAFATLALGGFSTHDASIGFFDSPAIEAILIFFMLVAGANFATHFRCWRRKSVSPYANDPEFYPYIVVLIGSCLAIGAYLWIQGTYDSFWLALRHASFNLVSIAVGCGLVSVDYNQWPIFAPLWMLYLSCISACSGSTGGGIRMIRTLILFRQAYREMTMLLHRYAVQPLKIGGTVVANKLVFSVLAFVFSYFLCVVTMSFLLMASGLDFLTAFSGVIACINNAGPGLNLVGPATNYGGLSDFQTWVYTITMLLGRLEIFTLLIIFTPAFWRR